MKEVNLDNDMVKGCDANSNFNAFDKVQGTIYDIYASSGGDSGGFNPSNVTSENLKDYWKRLAKLIVSYKPSVIAAINSSGIQLTANATDEQVMQTVTNGIVVEKNMALVKNIAALMRAHHQVSPTKDSFYA